MYYSTHVAVCTHTLNILQLGACSVVSLAFFHSTFFVLIVIKPTGFVVKTQQETHILFSLRKTDIILGRGNIGQKWAENSHGGGKI